MSVAEGDVIESTGPEVRGKSDISSCTSVTTRPLDVISLFRIIRI